ncbi:MAG: hypothetical protein RL480_981, partial [Pseudomonadota bacterium]
MVRLKYVGRIPKLKLSKLKVIFWVYFILVKP